ncbi:MULTISPECIES: 3-oxoacid CoA-transferase subunit B [unclassified Bacillus (in: firmicutes)]|uniref:3-oxoacid CoA-transferase subunit B n=1 Tax=unclassified Bacillus (in: firmicutes) TaxID=185979 RepID=UPI0008EB073F|nr:MULTISPECIES: 3-oxoacid CoA-transferase subunit B [unclassified Bacillus (in: firmicutes)]SFA69641.1 3-oxoacid CoA-transferase [Bacillus sp. UNCCL13]SFQ58970.1 3-oxoacid CoA-transferase [Bacillus sp. cl95]
MSHKEFIAKRAAKALEDGDIVNLGIGIPTLVADYVPEEIEVYLHSENGILGVGPTPKPEEIDKNLVNAGKLPVTIEEGSSFFDSASSFAMIRGGHVDVSILGVLQVDEKGRVANWAVPGKSVLGVGGAMDLLEGSKRVIVTTLHTTKEGDSKIVKELQYPITSERRVDLIITELAVFEVEEDGLVLIETAPGISVEHVEKNTEATFRVSQSVNGDLAHNRTVNE